MKQTYLHPNTLSVALQHNSRIMTVTSVQTNVDIDPTPQPDDGTEDAIPRVKVLSNIWDNEW